MRPKKPYRFQRIVLAAIKKQDTPESPSVWLNGPDVVKLLRKEQQAVGRMVQKFPGEQYEYVGQEYGCLIDKGEILDQLKKRAT